MTTCPQHAHRGNRGGGARRRGEARPRPQPMTSWPHRGRGHPLGAPGGAAAMRILRHSAISGSLKKSGTLREHFKVPHSLVTLEIKKPAREITDGDARAHCLHRPGLETAPCNRRPSQAGQAGGRRTDSSWCPEPARGWRDSIREEWKPGRGALPI